MKKLLLVFAVAGPLLMGCKVQDETKDRPVIGVTLLTTTNPFFQAMGEGIQAAAEKAGYDVIITSGDYDIGKQKNQISDFVVGNVAAIILTPVDSKSIGTAVAEANRAGIPVFTADVGVAAEGVQIEAHVATDNVQAGRMAAQAMIEATGGSGKIGIIDHPEVESVIQRTRGFLEEIADKAPGLKVVMRLPGSGEKDKAYKAAEDMLQAVPDLRGIFAINDPSALGAVAAIEKSNKKGITVISIDGQPEGRQAIKDGKIYALSLQYPDRIGQEAVNALLRYMRAEPQEKQILIPTSLYRRQDAVADPTLK